LTRSRKGEGMDQDLVVRAQRGDQRAFETLTAKNHPRLFRVAHGILGDPHLAEDATQQALLDIWRNIPRLRDPAKFEGWSYRLLVNACYAEAKRKPDWMQYIDVATGSEPMTGETYTSVVERDRLGRAFERLSLEHRSVIVLRYLLDMTPERVAETLGIPRRTVYSRLKRAMPAMRAALEADTRPVAEATTSNEVIR
jgi:RNA polymerase sigma-70 factor (ECF subfamily)